MKILSEDLKEKFRIKGKYAFQWFSFFVLLLLLAFIICYHMGWYPQNKETKPKYQINYVPYDWKPQTSLTKEIIEKPIIQYVDREITREVQKPIYVDREVVREVPVEITKYVNQPVYIDKPIETIKYVDREVEKIVKVPEIQLMPIDTETINNLKNEINEKKQLITELETKITTLTEEKQQLITDLIESLNPNQEKNQNQGQIKKGVLLKGEMV
ncbi:hypothetical protein PSOLA_00490 [Candidatus Phytoplasma solani]